MKNEVKFYTSEEICEVLRIGKRTFYTLVKNGKMESSRYGHKILVSEKQLQRYLQEQKKNNF